MKLRHKYTARNTWPCILAPVGDNYVKINDEQYDHTDATYTESHELAHFFLRKHPNASIRNMSDSPTKHDLAGKGILHYYAVDFTFYVSQINPSENNHLMMTTSDRQDVNQANVDEFLKSIPDTGTRQEPVTPSKP